MKVIPVVYHLHHTEHKTFAPSTPANTLAVMSRMQLWGLSKPVWQKLAFQTCTAPGSAPTHQTTILRNSALTSCSTFLPIFCFQIRIQNPQDFPIMPVETVGFMLKPYGFFNWNPTLDLPPDVNKASKQYQETHSSSSSSRKALLTGPDTPPRPRL